MLPPYLEHPYGPPPGSPDAVRAGCICPVEHNLGGSLPPVRDHWWVAKDCDLHRCWQTAQEATQ
jgi:hypothetical protein